MEKEIDALMKVFDNLRRIFQAINEYSKAAERSTGLTGPQLWALKLMAEEPVMRVSGLAEKMYLRPPTVVGILDRLEKKGLVVRTHSTKDRRVVEVSLTELGESLLAKAPEVVQTVLMKGLKELSDEQFCLRGRGDEADGKSAVRRPSGTAAVTQLKQGTEHRMPRKG